MTPKKSCFPSVPVRAAVFSQYERLENWLHLLQCHHHDVPAYYCGHVQPVHELLYQELPENGGAKEEAEIDCAQFLTRQFLCAHSKMFRKSLWHCPNNAYNASNKYLI
jgi:hypothetical protein